MSGHRSSSGDGPRPTRRGLLRAGAALGLVALTSSGLGPGDQLVLRRARFIERGDDVLMELDVPELFPATDRDAIASLEANVPTKLVFEIGVFPSYKRAPVRVVHREVTIWRDPWASPSRFEVTVEDDGRRRKPRYFDSAAEAVKAAVHLRVRIAAVADVGRGRNATHYVRISALRNPLEDTARPRRPDTRARNQDVAYLRQWISVFVRQRTRAEVALDIRTLPDFYLLEAPPAAGSGGRKDGEGEG